MERRWVTVAYPDGRGPEGDLGGLLVAEFETVIHGFREEDNLVPAHAPRVQLARTMAEKIEVLKRMRGSSMLVWRNMGAGAASSA